jgi:hypothetical protein
MNALIRFNIFLGKYKQATLHFYNDNMQFKIQSIMDARKTLDGLRDATGNLSPLEEDEVFFEFYSAKSGHWVFNLRKNGNSCTAQLFSVPADPRDHLVSRFLWEGPFRDFTKALRDLCQMAALKWFFGH